MSKANRVVVCAACEHEIIVPTGAKLASSNCPRCGAVVGNLKSFVADPKVKPKKGKKP